MLELRIDHRQGDFHLDVDIRAPEQGVTALFGHSGSGKTSLLRMLAGLDRPDDGHIRLGERTYVDTRQRLFVPPHRRRLGVVFQEARLFPHYRVRGNLTYARRLTGGEAFDRVVSLLGIEPLLARMPDALSGGEARRVAIGRALLAEPDMLLLDEPLTGLDGARKRELLDYILRLTREIELPILFISHDTQELMAIAERLVLLDSGRVVADGELDELLGRAELAPWLGGFEASTPISARVEAHDERYHATRLALDDGQLMTLPRIDHAPGERVRLRIRRRDVALAREMPSQSSFRNRLRATVEQLDDGEPGMVEVSLRLAGQRLLSRITLEASEALALSPGDDVIALIRSASLAGSAG
ncbi:molybdenum ABC transporter ATP-binding protein [Kushneria aurantia]|uniref:Molybdenum ABC transporter ATP-binding protein n=1 Tax=Kushneria aurantia TaxID=504092 RepID=A0ABV6G148_9GAMM|nr:molybdenum ABC transporter ATP-binding protein [Kushneria aurantia]